MNRVSVLELYARRLRFLEDRQPAPDSPYRERCPVPLADLDLSLSASALASALGSGMSNWDYFGVQRPSSSVLPEVIRRVLADCAESARRDRVASWRYRVAMEAADKLARGWYCVFDTRTLDSDEVDDWRDHFESSGSRFGSWRSYLRRVTRVVGAASLGCSERECDSMDSSDWVSRMSCVEWDGVRPHMHDLWFFRDIPASWKRDPNWGSEYPVHREVLGMRDLWPYGLTMPIAVRTSVDDAWGRLGWRWPIDADGDPVVASVPDVLGSYLAKYLSKSGGEKCLRMRASRQFGLLGLRRRLARLSPANLRRLESEPWPERVTLSNGLTLPTQLLKRELRHLRFSSRLASMPNSEPRIARLLRARAVRRSFVARLRSLRTLTKRRSAEYAALRVSSRCLTTPGSCSRLLRTAAAVGDDARVAAECDRFGEWLSASAGWAECCAALREVLSRPLAVGVKLYAAV